MQFPIKVIDGRAWQGICDMYVWDAQRGDEEIIVIKKYNLERN